MASPFGGSTRRRRGWPTSAVTPAGTVGEAALVARVALRYDETKADLVHDQEYEAVLFPLAEHVDVTRAVAVDYDDRDLRERGPDGWTYRLSDAPLDQSTLLQAGRARTSSTTSPGA